MCDYVGFRYMCDAKRYQENNGGMLAYNSKHHPERTKLYKQIIVHKGIDKDILKYIVWKPKDYVTSDKIWKIEIERNEDIYSLYAVDENGIVKYSAVFNSTRWSDISEWIELIYNDSEQ